MHKRVLIITYYWPPAGGGGVQRWVKFVKYLRCFGWEPIVYTVENGDYPIIDETMGKDLPKDITVLKQSIIEPYAWYRRFLGKKKGTKMDANFLSEGKRMTWRDNLAVWIRGNFFIPDARCLWINPSAAYLLDYLTQNPVDAMISTGPPHSCHLIAEKIKIKMDIPWIIDYRDPWTQIDYFNDLHLSTLARQRHLTLEKRVLNKCNLIVTVGKTMVEDLKELTDKRTAVITNGFDETDRATDKVKLDAAFTLTYIGTMNDARNPEVLWRVLEKLKIENDPIIKELKVKLVGRPEECIKKSIKKYGLEDLVECTGYVSHAEAIKYQNAARLLLLVINRTSNNKSILTGKIFEYLASGRPILCIGPADGDAAEIIGESGAGIMKDYEDVTGIISYLRQSYAAYKSSSEINHAQNIDKYSRKSLTSLLAGHLNSLFDKKE